MAFKKVYSVCSAKTSIPCAFMFERPAGRVYEFFKAMLGEKVAEDTKYKCGVGIASVTVLRELTKKLSDLTGHEYVLNEGYVE